MIANYISLGEKALVHVHVHVRHNDQPIGVGVMM